MLSQKCFPIFCRQPPNVITHNKKLRNLIPGYEVNPVRFLHDTNKVIFNFSLSVLIEEKRLGFLFHNKRLIMLNFNTS